MTHTLGVFRGGKTDMRTERGERRGGKKIDYSRKRKGGKRRSDGGRRKTYRKKRGWY